MAKRKPEEPPAGAPEWMATYSDLVTLLFCFFVLLYSMSNIDAAKFQQLANSFSGNLVSMTSFGSGNGISDLLGNGVMELPEMDNGMNESLHQYKEMQDKLETMTSEWKTYFAENAIINQGVEVDVSEKEVRIKFPEGILFDSGKAVLKPAAYDVLDFIGNKVLTEYPDSMVRIEGHTDNAPINTVQYPNNWYLSYARAAEVLTYFTDKIGIAPTSITPLGLGEYSPVASNDTPEGREKNRRVEIVIMSEYFTDNRE